MDRLKCKTILTDLVSKLDDDNYDYSNIQKFCNYIENSNDDHDHDDDNIKWDQIVEYLFIGWAISSVARKQINNINIG